TQPIDECVVGRRVTTLYLLRSDMVLIDLVRKVKEAAKRKPGISSQTDLEHRLSSRLKSLSAGLIYVLDVGANIGQSAIPFSKLKLESGRIKVVIHSFEPIN